MSVPYGYGDGCGDGSRGVPIRGIAISLALASKQSQIAVADGPTSFTSDNSTQSRERPDKLQDDISVVSRQVQFDQPIIIADAHIGDHCASDAIAGSSDVTSSDIASNQD